MNSGAWSWVGDSAGTANGAVIDTVGGVDFPIWDTDAGGDGERVDATGIQIYLFSRGDGSEWQFDRDSTDADAGGDVYASMCQAQVCTPAVDCAGSWSACTAGCEAADARTWTGTADANDVGAACPAAADCAAGEDECPVTPVDCAGTWSDCTVACEAAAARTFTTDDAQAGTGTACPATADCAPADDNECVAVDCAGTWSACTAACEVAADRNWTGTAAALGGGAACPAAADCAAGTGACPAAATPAPVAAAGAGMATASLAATAIAVAVAMY